LLATLASLLYAGAALACATSAVGKESPPRARSRFPTQTTAWATPGWCMFQPRTTSPALCARCAIPAAPSTSKHITAARKPPHFGCGPHPGIWLGELPLKRASGIYSPGRAHLCFLRRQLRILERAPGLHWWMQTRPRWRPSRNRANAWIMTIYPQGPLGPFSSTAVLASN